MGDCMGIFRLFWGFLGRPSLSVWVIYLLLADILAGSVIMRHHPKIFSALESRTLQDWAITYGLKNIHITWWLFASLILLFLLAITTSVCTTNKTTAIMRKSHGGAVWELCMRLSPSMIHLGFVLLLAGQLASHTLGVNSHGHILDIGGRTTAPGSDIVVVLKDLKIEFFKANSPFLGMEGRAKNVSGTLYIHDGHGVHERMISINHPVMYRGWGFFIDDFSPQSEEYKRAPYVNLTLRRDPGIRLIIAGAIAFGIGLMCYLISVVPSRGNERRVSHAATLNDSRGPQRTDATNGRCHTSHLLLLLPLFLLLASGCSADFEHYGEFTVKSLENGDREITDGIGRKLWLVPRGNEALKTVEKGRTVRIPVQKVVVYSAFNAALIKELGQVNSIAGVIAAEDRWHISEIRDGITNGNISYLGEYKSIDYERLKAIQPDVVFTWDDGVIPKLEELSIPCVMSATKIAKDLTAHINFIRFIAAFYCEEDRATSFVEAQFRKIDEIFARLKDVKTRPKVVWGDIYERKVLVEPGNSWAGQMAEKAGGDYLFRDLEGASCMQVTLEKFFSRTKGADILITYRGPESGIASKENLRQSSRLLQAVEINPMNEGKIYFTGNRLYQTADVAEIIEELASILHPTLFPKQRDSDYFYELPRE